MDSITAINPLHPLYLAVLETGRGTRARRAAVQACATAAWTLITTRWLRSLHAAAQGFVEGEEVAGVAAEAVMQHLAAVAGGSEPPRNPAGLLHTIARRAVMRAGTEAKRHRLCLQSADLRRHNFAQRFVGTGSSAAEAYAEAAAAWAARRAEPGREAPLTMRAFHAPAAAPFDELEHAEERVSFVERLDSEDEAARVLTACFTKAEAAALEAVFVEGLSIRNAARLSGVPVREVTLLVNTARARVAATGYEMAA